MGKIWQQKSHAKQSNVLWLEEEVSSISQCDRGALYNLGKLRIFSIQQVWIAGVLYAMVVGINYFVLPSSASQLCLIHIFHVFSLSPTKSWMKILNWMSYTVYWNEPICYSEKPWTWFQLAVLLAWPDCITLWRACALCTNLPSPSSNSTLA